MKSINFNQEKLDALRQEIAKAKQAGVATFHFEGAELAVPYAEYVCEYVTEQLAAEQVAHSTLSSAGKR